MRSVLVFAIAICAAALVLTGCGRGGATSGQAQSAEVQVGAKSEPPKRASDFTIVSQEPSDDNGRKRLIAKIVVPATLDSDQALSNTRAAIEQLLPADGSVQAVEVLVYRDKSETNGDFTYAKGYAALDGKGWDGSGWFVTAAGKKVSDRSNIELDVKNGSSIDHNSLAR